MNQRRGLWAHSGGEASCLVAAAAPNNLCLLLRTTAVNQQISAWARTKKWRIIGWCRLHQPELGFHSVLTVFKDVEVQTFYFTPISSLKWQFETLPRVSELFSSCTCSLRPPLSCHHRHIAKSARIVFFSAPTSQLLKPSLKSNQHLLQCRCLLLSASLPFPFLALFTLSSSLASHTDEQMLPRHRVHILTTTGCWLQMSLPCLINAEFLEVQNSFVSNKAEAGFVFSFLLFFFFKGGNPWYSTYGQE